MALKWPLTCEPGNIGTRFSDWPTYPQLYIGGDLVGGLDIVKEMVVRHGWRL